MLKDFFLFFFIKQELNYEIIPKKLKKGCTTTHKHQ